MTDEERTPEWLDHMIELIDLVEDELRNITLGQFAESRSIRDLTAFRLAQIGELAKKLPEALRNAHPQIDWTAMRSMRNYIVHEYHRIDWKIVFVTATTKLTALRSVCVDELARRDR